MNCFARVAATVALLAGLSVNSVSAATYSSGDILTIGPKTVVISDGESIVGDMGVGFDFTLDSTGENLVTFASFTIDPVTASAAEKPALVAPLVSTGSNPIVGLYSFISNFGGGNLGQSILHSDTYYGTSISGSVVSVLFNNLGATGSVIGLPGYGDYIVLTFVTKDGTSLVDTIASGDILSVTINGANSVVPIPASGWMVLTALFCLFLARPRKHRVLAV